MIFVRWHYRAGTYVHSHYRRRRLPPHVAQSSLLPTLAVHRPEPVAHEVDRGVPSAAELPGQVQLAIGA